VADTHQHAVLFIEDHADGREAYAALASTVGLDMVAVGDGREALRRLRDGLRPCLILLDLRMPEMDGFAFRREQLADPALARIPVAVVSGGGYTVEAEARKLGLHTFLRKPVDPADVMHLFTDHCAPRQKSA